MAYVNLIFSRQLLKQRANSPTIEYSWKKRNRTPMIICLLHNDMLIISECDMPLWSSLCTYIFFKLLCYICKHIAQHSCSKYTYRIIIEMNSPIQFICCTTQRNNSVNDEEIMYLHKKLKYYLMQSASS